MKTILLAGGASSRFAPFNSKSKTVFRLMGKPILQHTLDNFKGMGIKEVTTVLSNDMDFSDVNSNLLFKIRKVVQSKPRGQADALLTAWKKMEQRHPVLVLNAQHFTARKYIPGLIEKYQKTGHSVVGVMETENPWNYGVVQIKGDQITGVVEKPAKGKEPSNLRIVGIYLLTPEAIELIASLPTSDYQLEAGLDKLAKNNKLRFVKLKGELPSLKYSWDLLAIKDILLAQKRHIDKTAFVHKTALIEGPCWIGPKAVVGAYCILRKGVILEEAAEIQRYVEIKNSIIGKNSHLHSGYLGDSIIGENCRIGAGFITANRRFDRKNILIKIKGETVDSGLTSLGVMMGDGVKIGIQCGTMPGTIIEAGSILDPGEIVKGLVKKVQ